MFRQEHALQSLPSDNFKLNSSKMDPKGKASSSPSKSRIPIRASSSRIAFLKSVAPPDTEALLDHLSDASPPPPTNGPAADDKANDDNANRLQFANDLATITDEHPVLTKALLADPNVKSLRDVALNYGDDKLDQLLAPTPVAKPSL